MKKIIVFILTAVMLLGAVACAGTPSGNDDADIPDTLAGKLFISFRDALKGGMTSTEELANAVLATKELEPLFTMAMPVEPGYLAGFDAEIHGFKEGATFAPMISSIPFVGYILVPADGTTAEELAKNLEDNANLNWNICVTADEMFVKVVDGYVFFVMCPLEIVAE